MTEKLQAIDTTEEMILNQDGLPEYMRGCRRFRIEYINDDGFSNLEGTIYVPGNVDCYPFLDKMVKDLSDLFGIPYRYKEENK